MKVMNLQAKKLELVQMILNTNRPSLLDKVSKLLSQERDVDWWDELPLSVQQSIDESIKQADRGEIVSHEEIMKEVKLKYGL